MNSNTLKILIIEDSTAFAEELEVELIELGYNITDNVRNSTDGLNSFRKNIPDIAIIDINLEDSQLDGIDLAHKFNRIFRIPLIYYTSYADKELQERAKATEPAYYLIKSANALQLEVAIEFSIDNFIRKKEALLNHSLQYHQISQNSLYAHQEYFFVKNTKKNLVRINLKDLLFVKAEGTMVKIVTTDNIIYFSVNLKNFQIQVSYPSLVRIHNSFVANINRIKKIEDNYLIFDDSKSISIPIGRKYKESVFKLLKRLRAN